MPGISPLCGTGPLINFGGRSIEVRGRTLRDMGSVESRVMFLRGDPVSLCRQLVIEIEDKDHAKESAIQTIEMIRHSLSGASHQDMGRWLSSFEGRIFSVWRSVRHAIPEYDEASRIACDLIDELGMSWLENVEWAIEIANGRAEHQLLIEIRCLFKSPESGSDSPESRFPNYDDLYRSFSREPFSMSSDEILNLTLHQIQLLAKEDDNGSDERDVEMAISKSKGMTKELYRLTWGAPYELLADNIVNNRCVTSQLN